METPWWKALGFITQKFPFILHSLSRDWRLYVVISATNEKLLWYFYSEDALPSITIVRSLLISYVIFGSWSWDLCLEPPILSRISARFMKKIPRRCVTWVIVARGSSASSSLIAAGYFRGLRHRKDGSRKPQHGSPSAELHEIISWI